MALGILYKIPIYPIFYLLEADYRSSALDFVVTNRLDDLLLKGYHNVITDYQVDVAY